MSNTINLKGNRNRFILNGFFFTSAMAIAEPSTILPLIINYFSDSKTLVGLFTALLKGGAIVMQLWAAYHIQNKPRVMGPMSRVFAARFFSWVLLGVLIYLFGSGNHTLMLILFGIGLFVFSFAAGFGAVYFQEIIGKSFTREYRGGAIARRQFWSGLAAILSGGITGLILSGFDKPQSFGHIFTFSSLIMLVSFIVFVTIKEPVKQHVVQQRDPFGVFLRKSFQLLRSDSLLKNQVLARLLSYSFLFALPFVVLQAKNHFTLTGGQVGLLVSLQMTGAMLSNLLWGRLAGKNKNKRIVITSYFLALLAISLSLFSQSVYFYYALFFLIGMAIDGFKLAFSHLILIIAPEEERPTYIAVQNNITSLGLFFSLPGGMLFDWLGFQPLIAFTLFMLLLGGYFSLRLKKYCEPKSLS